MERRDRISYIQTMEGPTNPDLYTQLTAEIADNFANRLISVGHTNIRTVGNLPGRSIVATYRSVPPDGSYTSHPFLSPQWVFSGGGGEWEGVTRIDVIDLFERINVSDQTVYLPIAHRGYSVAEIDGQVIANGNKTKRVENLHRVETWPLEKNEWFDPYEFVDRIVSVDGLYVADPKKVVKTWVAHLKHAGQLDSVIETRLNHLFPTMENPWQGRHLGKFLAALGILLLKKRGITEIDYKGELSEKSASIMQSLGYKGTLRQDINTHNYEAINQTIAPFIP